MAASTAGTTPKQMNMASPGNRSHLATHPDIILVVRSEPLNTLPAITFSSHYLAYPRPAIPAQSSCESATVSPASLVADLIFPAFVL